ncbi:hypothetical protein PG985_013759 [Apiospora marii]|uniref:uncharacterized protein n=1 Tax=Apiospora marii TaxID=335849 RepID=UPI003130A4A9
MDQQASIDPDDLPLGTSATTVLTFNFLEAIEQFKKTLPDDYIRDSWFNVLKKQCAESTSSSATSLLYLQVVFLKDLYRRVVGDIGPKSGWEKMPTMISEMLNGPEDVRTCHGDMFYEAKEKESAEELLACIAYYPSPGKKMPKSITTAVRVATKTSVATVIKDEAGTPKADGDDESEIARETSSSTSGNKKRKVSTFAQSATPS